MRRTRGTGSIIKLKWYEKDGTRVSRKTPGAVKCESAYWYILYRGRDGVQRRAAARTESKTKAENLLIERLGEIRRGFTPAQDLKSLYYEDIRDAYLRDKPDQQKNYHLRPLNAFFAGMRVTHITTGTIRDFIDERREEVEDPTIRRDLIPLRAMFSLAVKEKAINESDKPYFPMPKDSDPAGEYIDEMQFEKILNGLSLNLRPFFQMLYGTACRLGALQKITWGMVNENCDEIRLPAKFVKNKKPLTLYLIGHFLEPVVRHLKNRKRGANHKVLLDFTNYRPEWNKAVAAAGLGTWDPKKRLRTGVRIHDCRCSGAINAVDAGIEWDIVKKIGGWKTDEMLSRYNVLTDKRVKAAMEKLSEHTRDKLKKAQEKQQQEQEINVLAPSQSTATSAYQN